MKLGYNRYTPPPKEENVHRHNNHIIKEEGGYWQIYNERGEHIKQAWGNYYDACRQADDLNRHN